MYVAFTLRARRGHEKEFEALLSNPEAGRVFPKLMGATRNLLFLREGSMIRVLEVPEGVRPTPMGELTEREPSVKEFLRKIGPIVKPGFDIERPETLEAFNRQITHLFAYDVRV